MGNDYKNSMNLPNTDFPMRAGLPTNEPIRLKKWEDMKLYEKVIEKNKDGEHYILHDGPPYANGPIHIGHAFNKILKDFCLKSRMIEGKYTPYVPGWDCHGQPIEHMVEMKLGPEKMAKIDILTLRRLCREWATKYVGIQRDGFKRLGVLAEWDNPYLTYLPEYEAGNVEIFKKMYADGSVYRGRKPIHWCKRCHTALAEAEIEYGDEVSPSIYVRFAMDEIPAVFADAGLQSSCDVLIWTTTPWTLPANAAVSLAPDADYVIVQVAEMNLLMAEALVETVASVAKWDSYALFTNDAGEVVRAKGIELAELTYTCPIRQDLKGKLIYGDHVTLDSGTGCVHTAPGHGQDDYLVGMQFDIPILMPVDDNGCLTKDAGICEGIDTDKASPLIIDWLREHGTFIAHVDINHSYPHCWRCHEPVIFRATDQWFVSMDETNLRKDALQAIKDTTWYPAWSENRITAMVADRPDWCISRQRSWGVPIPVFKCKKCGETIATPETFDAVIKLFNEEGADAWFAHEPHEYLPEDTCCPKCASKEIEPEKDILDVWWESGVSHQSVLNKREYLDWPAAIYLEGSDQHRGWFQSSLLCSVGAFGRAPYDAVVSCGFTVDGEGRKMSKSLGNGVDPADVIAKAGADVLRLWVASVDSSQDVAISDEIIDRTSEAYRRIRNTFRFLLSNLYDFDVKRDSVAVLDMPELDRRAIAKLSLVVSQIDEAYETYRFHNAYRAVYDYFVTDLSSIYMDVTKDRLYSDAPDSLSRRSAQTVLSIILQALVRKFAPILTFTCDEVWEYMNDSFKDGAESVYLANPYVIPEIPNAEQLLEDYSTLFEIREAVTKALENARADKIIGKSQEAIVELELPTNYLAIASKRSIEQLAELFIVSDVSLAEATGDEILVRITRSEKDKCPRCWNIRDLGADANHPDLCERCAKVISSLEGE